MASKIKGRPPKQPKVTPALPSNDSQQLHENNPGNNLALETCGESSSSHGTGGPKPGPSKKTLNERKRKYGVSVNKTVQNIEWNVDHFLKVQHERRQELYKDYSHQFLTLVMMWNIDVDQIKKQAGKLSDILDEQQKLFQQFQSIHMQKIEEFKELCDRHLKNLQAIKCCRRKAIIEEARKLMDYLEKRVTEETVHVNKQEAKDGVQSSLLSLLIS
ncbi:X-linked lymphocyte-regulated 4B isoform X1 [Mus musculus]|uniref:X-linked lymphocyte regulated gene 4 n=1 Tax=Mus musculus TaxID=10090 RepID=Q9JJQ7_MOUSE|nr:X-linked lymphocyte-regulated 4B [Mus musculus]NP_001280606.1 X-linked lymphocyte-regulated 4B [Mus musculus]NP_001280607.1 X-linked lymphocyte-regulated 4B [Mus musculus]NP_001280608.1 X-linked lymphocyte-regulated 4B [Mus musculus]NP_001280609.1 X-linked lymphocyte-regulated 4B [Mus musculus]NP_067340.2 X-linked lymphocyte-regulated 4B [Mus musculus]XP_006528124.1 X-linked lymphocyte-regulated 4B isoform X1 [Mus musculus]XP_011245906.1 X-linked lymphocyte-regulated 4B isoform X1 [Mus mu|eukprot:NP_001280605.1 X-linked lymphocyte-regulated 4B [Mus musculus]